MKNLEKNEVDDYLDNGFIFPLNILNDQEVVPEYLQRECSSNLLSQKLESILADSKYQKHMRGQYAATIDKLRIPVVKASDLAASVVNSYL
jgi:lipid A disaccharide synthetase